MYCLDVQSLHHRQSEWLYPPFSAHKDEHGDIYARGTQDMKGVACMYMEAVRRLGAAPLPRTVHLVFVPGLMLFHARSQMQCDVTHHQCADEEIGGNTGMALFVQSAAFRKLNVGASSFTCSLSCR